MQFFHTKAITPVIHGLRAMIPHFLSSPLFGVRLCICIITIPGLLTDPAYYFHF